MLEHYDVIIVLGGGIDEQGAIPSNVALRVKEAVHLLNQNIASRIIMSGKWGYSAKYIPPRTEANAMKELAVQSGANSKAIFLEESSMDTLGNAYFCKTLFLITNNWRHVLVLVSDHHAQRTEYLFKKVLGPDYTLDILPVVTELEPTARAEKEDRHARSLKLAQERLGAITDGDDMAIWELMSTQHPAYATNPKVSKEELEKMLVHPQ